MPGLEHITYSDDSNNESNVAAVSEEVSVPNHAPVVSCADNGGVPFMPYALEQKIPAVFASVGQASQPSPVQSNLDTNSCPLTTAILKEKTNTPMVCHVNLSWRNEGQLYYFLCGLTGGAATERTLTSAQIEQLVMNQLDEDIAKRWGVRTVSLPVGSVCPAGFEECGSFTTVSVRCCPGSAIYSDLVVFDAYPYIAEQESFPVVEFALPVVNFVLPVVALAR
ncbi:hypothetical protein DFH09DRAFT_1076955 [Mycena vulgaris]|nr:hypothetical protein DFH09DRAFT_1076955 [Mycena vulgaris]